MVLLLKEMHCLSSQEIFLWRKFFAEFSRIPLGKLVLLIYWWSLHQLRSKSADMVRLTWNTVGNMFAMLRYLCKRDLQIRPITPFGGRVFLVKCDESQFSTNRRWWDNRIWSLFWIVPDYPEKSVSDRFIQVQPAEACWKEALFLSSIAGGISVSNWFRSRDRPRNRISVLPAWERHFSCGIWPSSFLGSKPRGNACYVG